MVRLFSALCRKCSWCELGHALDRAVEQTGQHLEQVLSDGDAESTAALGEQRGWPKDRCHLLCRGKLPASWPADPQISWRHPAGARQSIHTDAGWAYTHRLHSQASKITYFRYCASVNRVLARMDTENRPFWDSADQMHVRRGAASARTNLLSCPTSDGWENLPLLPAFSFFRHESRIPFNGFPC